MSDDMENGESAGLISQRDRELNFTHNDSRIFNTDRTSKVERLTTVWICCAVTSEDWHPDCLKLQEGSQNSFYESSVGLARTRRQVVLLTHLGSTLELLTYRCHSIVPPDIVTSNFQCYGYQVARFSFTVKEVFCTESVCFLLQPLASCAAAFIIWFVFCQDSTHDSPSLLTFSQLRSNIAQDPCLLQSPIAPNW
ncbi:hypothetical protein RRG08_060170 [Elysia crispata]|uniref:Uncharacterized protein n=1 Tax=Elysia crispata TaxID=231223 RepID=A0AAE1DPM6_9GAST|nr:hypothetical protein RRG08_060170 [Elysia crispata]